MKILTVAGYVAIVALVLAGTAAAENYGLDVPASAKGGNAQNFYTAMADAWTQDAIYTTTESADTVDVSLNPDGIPGWLHLVIPEEATLTRGRIVFKEADNMAYTGATQTYSWGDTVNFFVGEAKFDDWFHVSGWDEVEIRLVGSASGKVDVYCWAELYTDSE